MQIYSYFFNLLLSAVLPSSGCLHHLQVELLNTDILWNWIQITSMSGLHNVTIEVRSIPASSTSFPPKIRNTSLTIPHHPNNPKAFPPPPAPPPASQPSAHPPLLAPNTKPDHPAPAASRSSRCRASAAYSRRSFRTRNLPSEGRGAFRDSAACCRARGR
jgi:hypothetical protein